MLGPQLMRSIPKIAHFEQMTCHRPNRTRQLVTGKGEARRMEGGEWSKPLGLFGPCFGF